MKPLSQEKSGSIAAMSTGASCDKSAGHFYWHYLGLIQNHHIPLGVDFRLIAGLPSENPSCHQLFSPKAHGKRFRVGPATFRLYRFSRALKLLGRLESEGVRAVYAYEGSLADLALLFYLAQRMPDSVFVYNFFWPQEWKKVLEGQKWIGLVLGKLLRKSPRNLLFTADTPTFAAYLENYFRYPLEPFPSFSPHFFLEQAGVKTPRFDVLVVFKRSNELDFALNVVSQLALKRNLRVAVQGPLSVSESRKTGGDSAQLPFTQFGIDLTSTAYADLLTSTRVVFLAYMKSHFVWASSGKLLDAYQAGCNVFVPRNSGPHSQTVSLDFAGVETYSFSDSADAAKRLGAFLETKPEKRTQNRDVSYLFDFVFRFQRAHQESRNADTDADEALRSRYAWVVIIVVGLVARLSWSAGALKMRELAISALDRMQIRFPATWRFLVNLTKRQ